MKRRRINGTFDLVVPDNVADWDAPSDWERERINHMLARIGPSDVLFDIGVEHGWISAIFAMSATHRMVLVEPSPEFWPNIHMTWRDNHIPDPLACFAGFVGASSTYLPSDVHHRPDWPSQVAGPECDAMAYHYLHNDHNVTQGIPVITIDDLAQEAGPPNAITIDIEGAEMGALQGAEVTLSVHRPLVWVSVHPDLMERDYGTSPDRLYDLMRERGYDRTHLATDHEVHMFFEPRRRFR